MFGIGTTELIVILVIVLLIFGPKKIPELAKTLGRGLREFKKAQNEIRNGIDEVTKEVEEEVKGNKKDEKKS